MGAYRLILGRVSVPILQAGNLVEAFPRQTDQPPLLDWGVYGDSDQYFAHADVFEAFNGVRSPQGAGRLNWLMYMSGGMLDYWRRTFYGKTDNAEGGYSAWVTAETEDTTFGTGWRVVYALMQFPTPDRMTREGDIWGVPTTFIEAVAAPKGCDLVVAIVDEDEGDWEVGALREFRYTITNEGDFETTTPSILTVPIPPEAQLDSLSAAGWSVAYSINGTTYSGVPPTPLSDTTHLRFTRASSLAADASATLTVTLEALTDGETTLTAEVETSFEADDENNDADLEMTIEPAP
jgi:hypothetical protein